MPEFPKAYEPAKYEDEIYKKWEESGFFNPDVCVEKGVAEPDASPYSIVLPPPNVTGTLHMGHAAMLAIEDVMIRYHRMKGDRTLWVPGTDHAAVATESKVEGILIKEKGMKRPKEEMGREAFLERVRQFAQESHDTIVNQSKKMGSSLDWSREAFTLDEARNRAVRTVFKKMYEDGLIYRGYRVVNWSVKGQSTCSDDELVHVERPAKLYYFKYSKDFPITIATTRPETKLGDTAVAVNPNDERYKKYIGQTFVVDVGAEKPLSVKIIADEHVEQTFGTGALGVTPAHSMVDFDMYTREKATGNDIGLIQVIGEDGKMTPAAGKYAGLSVEEARNKFVEYLREQNLLEKEEDIVQNVGTSDRFKDAVEPLPKTQWFVDVNKKFIMGESKIKGIKSGQEVSLKELMKAVVREGQIEILPDRFNKTYFQWIDNLRDWCISRQIWYGHQIPVYYCVSGKCGEKTASVEKINKCPNCGAEVKQDPDTLDTWFSAGLWTFSTLGWPTAKVAFVRHGEAESNAQNKLDSEIDTAWNSLTKKGQKQISKAAKELKNFGAELIIASPLKRTKETAAILAENLNIPVVYDDLLREIGVGEFSGRGFEEFVKFRDELDENLEEFPKGVESVVKLKKRTSDFLKNVADKHGGKKIIVVSHGDPIYSMIAGEVLSFQKKDGLYPGNGQIIVKKIDSEGRINNDLEIYHPTSVLETGYDILFFWVARMILMTTYTLGDIPFKTVYLHGLVRDEQGRKMSKSLGNIIDPLDMIEKYGTDATRLSLLIGNTPGNDMKLSEEKIAGFRNFANKLWNISRFALLNIENPKIDCALPKAKTLADEWILAKLKEEIACATDGLEKYNLSAVGEGLREFTWNDFADWYLEIAKVEGGKSEILNYVLNTILKLWHPFMPFVTEAIWQEVYGVDSMLMVEDWPANDGLETGDLIQAGQDFAVVKDIITSIRSLRAEKKIEPVKQIDVTIVCDKDKSIVDKNTPIIRSLARVGSLTITNDQNAKPAQSAGIVVGTVHIFINLTGAVDTKKEKVRLQKEIATVEPYVLNLEKKLGNSEFVSHAPPAIVEVEQKKLSEAKEKLGALIQQLATLL